MKGSLGSWTQAAFSEKMVSQESWATFPDPPGFPMGLDKNRWRKATVPHSCISSESRCLYNWCTGWSCWWSQGMLPWSISCTLAPLRIFILKISEGKKWMSLQDNVEISVSRDGGFSCAEKHGFTDSLPAQYNSHCHIYALCIWSWKYIRSRNQYVYVIVPQGGWASSQTAETC